MRAQEIIDRLPYEFQARLEADEYCSAAVVVVADEGNVEQEIARKQAVVTEKNGKWGLAIIVLQVVGDDEYADVLFGPMILRPAFQVVEFVEQNRSASGTGVSAREMARRVVDVMKSLALYGMVTEISADTPCIEPVPVGDELGKRVRAYQVNFVTHEVPAEVPTQVAMPMFGEAGADFTLSCETAGAEIWYTTDESYPRPHGEADAAAGRTNTSQLYVEAVTVSPEQVPLVVRACAYKAGMIASQVNRAAVRGGA